MAGNDVLLGSIQESLLTAIAYAGDEAAPILAVVTADMFEGLYAEIAERILDFRQRFRKPPAPAHLDDLFDFVLDDPNHKHFRAYNRILSGMRDQAPSLNLKYLVDRVVQFARRQRLKEGFHEAVERFERGGEGFEDDVEGILHRTLKQHVQTISWGVKLSDTPLEFLDSSELDVENRFKLGIEEFDRLGIVPARGELYLFIGKRKAGKSWFLHHVGRAAARQRWNVAHASMENRSRLVRKRYVQSLFAVANRPDEYIRPYFDMDKGFLEDVQYEVLTPDLVFNNSRHLVRLRTKFEQHQALMDRIVIQEFPSGVMTVAAIENWLDILEAQQGFLPDVLLVDYPDLMKLDMRDPRMSLGRIFVDLRGLAGRRNIAIVTVTQSNREGETARTMRSHHVSEDISKIATADTIITFSQTDAEKRIGLARLFVAGARNDRDGFTILVSQTYDTGQFALETARMDASYWDILEEVHKDVSREKIKSRDDTAYTVDDGDGEEP